MANVNAAAVMACIAKVLYPSTRAMQNISKKAHDATLSRYRNVWKTAFMSTNYDFKLKVFL